MRQSLYICLIILSSCLNNAENEVQQTAPEQRKPNLIGNWVLDSTNLPFSSPARIPSFCNDLWPGSRFTFTNDSTLKVIAKDSTNECFEYSYNIHDKEL